MRLSLAIGVSLVAMGVLALYVLRNGFFMFLIGHAIHAPPKDPEALAAAFERLAEERADTPGMRVGEIAAARGLCLAAGADPRAAEAFRRVNLVLAGAGAGSLSPLIPPIVRRVPELRPDLTGLAPQPRAARQAATVAQALDALADPEAEIHLGLDLAGGFARLDLRSLVAALDAGGDGLAECMGRRGG